MSSHSLTLTDALKTLNPHDQLCLICETEEEWPTAETSFMIKRLQRNGKCMWVDVRRSGEEALNAISAIQGESKEILDASLEKTRRVLNAEGEKPS